MTTYITAEHFESVVFDETDDRWEYQGGEVVQEESGEWYAAAATSTLGPGVRRHIGTGTGLGIG